ncbi:hypothetical protein RB213_012486 [Colletotrichum asianum]
MAPHSRCRLGSGVRCRAGQAVSCRRCEGAGGREIVVRPWTPPIRGKEQHQPHVSDHSSADIEQNLHDPSLPAPAT